jgi:TolB-like protein/Tfp pilus assembly protein PilF
VPAPAPALAPAAVSPPPRRRWIAIATLAVLAAVTIGYFVLRSGPAGAPIQSIAVLPFTSLSDDPEQEYFSDGVTDELITRLAQLQSLRVISRSSVMRYKGTRKSAREIAAELGVEAIVEGTVSRSPERVRVSAQVLRVKPEEHVWAERYDRPSGDLVALQVQLAREIAEGIRVQLSASERTALGAHPKVDPVAHEAFLKGRYFWARRNEAGTRRAQEFFQAAIDADPDYAPAWAGLADVFITLSLPEALQEVLPPEAAYPHARAAVLRAIELDATLGDAHATLAHILFQYDRDWEGADREFRRAIELSPNYANAHQWFGLSLFWRGRVDEALREVRIAHELDPLSLVVNANECFILGGAGQFDAAIAQCRRTLELEPNFALARYRLGQVFIMQGKYAEAVVELRRTAELSGQCPRAVAELALALALSGDKEESARLLASLQAEAGRRYVGQFDLAVIHAALDQKDLALTALEKAYDEHSPSLSLLAWSPAFAELRTAPRYVALERRIGIR